MVAATLTAPTHTLAPPPRSVATAARTSAARRALVGAVLCVALAACTTPAPKRVEIVEAPADGDLATLVHAELARAERDHRRLVVYVGAPWCEPCQRFHAAAAAGSLDARFPTLRLYAFDADRDRDRLAAAGYTSTLIPLFALPAPDGRSSHRQIEGSVKGEAAVEQIAPRLAALLAAP